MLSPAIYDLIGHYYHIHMQSKMSKTLAIIGMCAIMATSTMTSHADIVINETNFPDAAFRSYIASTIDEDESGTLDDDEIYGTSSIVVRSLGIKSLKGIELFPELTTLWCDENELTVLDLSHNTQLSQLHATFNKLQSLDLSNNKSLTRLYIDGNPIATLDLCGNGKLQQYYCNGCKFKTLDLGANKALTRLYCNNNELESLHLNGNSKLTMLQCNNNKLTSLDLSGNTALRWLFVTHNKLSSLDVSKNSNLEWLLCYDNAITALDLTANVQLADVRCQHNRLATLAVGNNQNMTQLYCSNNALTSLDLSGATALTELHCDSNSIASLNLSKNVLLDTVYVNDNGLQQLRLGTQGKALAIKKLVCSNNHLSCLDLDYGLDHSGDALLEASNNGRVVNGVEHAGNASTITTTALAQELGDGFDMSRVTSWDGAQNDGQGHLKLTSDTVRYVYATNWTKQSIAQREPSFDSNPAQVTFYFTWTKTTAVDEHNMGTTTPDRIVYYDTLGHCSPIPFKGLNIVVRHYGNGSTSTSKVYR